MQDTARAFGERRSAEVEKRKKSQKTTAGKLRGIESDVDRLLGETIEQTLRRWLSLAVREHYSMVRETRSSNEASVYFALVKVWKAQRKPESIRLPMRRLMSLTKLSRRTVIRVLDGLECESERGCQALLWRDRKRGRPRRRAMYSGNVYYLIEHPTLDEMRCKYRRENVTVNVQENVSRPTRLGTISPPEATVA